MPNSTTYFYIRPPLPQKGRLKDQINCSEKTLWGGWESSDKMCMQVGSKPEICHSLLGIKSIDVQDPHLFDDSAFPRLTSPYKQTERMLWSVAEDRSHLSRLPRLN